MAAGPKMNALVAEKVMGWKSCTADIVLCSNGTQRTVLDGNAWKLPIGDTYVFKTVTPLFSTDISAAYAMEEELSKMDGHIQVGYVSRLYEILNIPFSKPLPLSTEESLKLIRATPEQRCRAALKAVMNIY